MEKGIVKREENKKMTVAERYLEQEKSITDLDFYSVGKQKTPDGRWVEKRVPSARVYNLWAQEKKIKTELLDKGKDGEKAWATVRGWIGDRENPEVEATEYVCHIFSDLFLQTVFDAIDRGIGQYDENGKYKKVKPNYMLGDNGKPIIEEEWAQLHIMREHMRERGFAERDAITKAQARVQKKLLGVEFREEAEIKMEHKEIHQINPSAKIEESSDPSNANEAPPTNGLMSPEVKQNLAKACEAVGIDGKAVRDICQTELKKKPHEMDNEDGKKLLERLASVADGALAVVKKPSGRFVIEERKKGEGNETDKV